MADISTITLPDGTTVVNLKDSKALYRSGGTMTGTLTLDGAPTSDLHAATKKYVDDAVGDISGGGGFYGVCDSSGTNRSVTINGFELKTGVAIDVKFTVDSGYKNYLNVNSTGNKLIYTDTYNYTQKQTWVSGQIVRFVYDGSSWIMVGSGNYVTAGLIDESIILGARATAEGHNATATGHYSHAEGDENTASGTASHSEGVSTTASGYASHSEGVGTTAQRKSQHVFGEFNELDTSGASESVRGQYVEIVGNGSSLSLSNARTLDWDGNEVLAGKLTVGAAPTNNMDAATKKYVDDAVPSEATENTYGLVKLNPSKSVTLNASGQLEVGGRLGQFPTTTGIYAPATITPLLVENGTLLITEASGTRIGTKSLSATTGFNITLSGSHAAGSTVYTVSNSYVNRILCSILLNGASACLNEAASSSGTVRVTSVKVGSADVAPSSTNSSTPITITCEASANPNNAATQIRFYPDQMGFSNLLFGQVGTKSGLGFSVAGGQQIFNGSNASAVFGNTQYNAGNASMLAGRQHINTKQNVFLAGQGHDTTSGSNAVSAVGVWSSISSTTLFAVGNGTSNTARSNAFEIKSTGEVLINGQHLDTAAEVEAAISEKFTYGNTDLTPGTSPLATGTFYAYYE